MVGGSTVTVSELLVDSGTWSVGGVTPTYSIVVLESLEVSGGLPVDGVLRPPSGLALRAVAALHRLRVRAIRTNLWGSSVRRWYLRTWWLWI